MQRYYIDPPQNKSFEFYNKIKIKKQNLLNIMQR